MQLPPNYICIKTTLNLGKLSTNKRQLQSFEDELTNHSVTFTENALNYADTRFGLNCAYHQNTDKIWVFGGMQHWSGKEATVRSITVASDDVLNISSHTIEHNKTVGLKRFLL